MCKEKEKQKRLVTLAASQPMLTKLQTEGDTRDEVDSVSEIRKIPLASHYFLLPEPEICHPNAREEVTVRRSCEVPFIASEKFKDLTMIQIPYGGKSLRTAEINVESFSFRGFMKHVLEGLTLLNRSGWVHADLHDGNILLSQNNMLPRIIDFGKLIRTTESDPTEIRNRFLVFEAGYEHIPIECLWFAGITKTNMPSGQIMEKVLLMKESLKLMNIFADYSTEEQATDLYNFVTRYVGENKKQATDLPVFWHTVAAKFDSWSIGVLFLYILRKLLTVPRFTQAGGEYAIAKSQILHVIRGLCCLDSYKRFLPQDALHLLKEGSSIPISTSS